METDESSSLSSKTEAPSSPGVDSGAAAALSSVSPAISLPPVSYTHLDVYKRQLDALTERAGAVEERFDILQSFSRGERRVSSQEPILLNAFLRQFYLTNQLDMEITGVDFHLKLPSTDIIVRGDKGRLNAALENLCYNALSFTPENGTVTLALKQEESYAVITVQAVSYTHLDVYKRQTESRS